MNFAKLDSLVAKYHTLSQSLSDPAIVGTAEWTRLVKECASLEPIVAACERLRRIQSDIASAQALLDDPEMSQLAQSEIDANMAQSQQLMTELRILLLPVDPHDAGNVIMEIRAGAGGDEASLFAAQLMRMYKMYAEKNNFRWEDISVSMTELGGVKEAIFELVGSGVYAQLKFESGVHRVQRVPETESQGRIHTSTVTVAVLAEAEDVEVEILDKDLRIDTYRSGGAGGQHVNKTESAIRITHIPTGIVVQCQDEKSQIKNREKAMKALKARLYDHFRTESEREYSQIRRSQVGTGNRNERIRTYNFPQGRVTDHRINLTLYSLDTFMQGDITAILEALRIADQTARLEQSD